MSETTRFGFVLRWGFPIFSPKDCHCLLLCISQSINSWLGMGPWDATLLLAALFVSSTHLLCLTLGPGEDAQKVEVAKRQGRGGTNRARQAACYCNQDRR